MRVECLTRPTQLRDVTRRANSIELAQGPR
jgi:hypothetical protein